jgi:hypothetical protein
MLPANQLQRLRTVRSIATAFAFDHGKMRETDFVGMPRIFPDKNLNRTLLAAAETDTFFYSTAQFQWPGQISSPQETGFNAIDILIRQLSAMLTAHGIEAADLQAAFADQLEIAARWPAESQWPSLVTCLALRDPERGRKIIEALGSVDVGATPWNRREKGGVIFYTAQPFGGFVPLTLTIALSSNLLVAGTDAEVIEATLMPAGRIRDTLTKSQVFLGAQSAVPSPDTGFYYLDTRLFYERLDAALRPMLKSLPTIFPSLGTTLDLDKIPPATAITKHLSPIVMSQRYESDGYVSESVGPVTFRQATVGAVGAIAAAVINVKERLRQAVPPAADTPSPTPGTSPQPTVP